MCAGELLNLSTGALIAELEGYKDQALKNG
jgi:hypothetical protein